MIVRFKSLVIKGFMSLVSESINLEDLGVVTVKGVNSYDKLFKSNGSGKSAIFDSILWCLTGSTSRGSSNVVNRNIPDCETLVTVDMMIDNDEFSITRTAGRTKSIVIVKNGEDISGSTLTKSKDILKSQLSFITYDVLTSIIILSQGLPSRLSSLRPSDRKTRLEYLSNTDGILEEIQGKISEAYNVLIGESSEINTDRTRITTSIQSNQTMVDNCDAKIREIKEYQENNSGVTPEDITNYSKKIEELQQTIPAMRKKYQELVKLESDLQSNRMRVNSAISSVESQIKQLSDQYRSLSSNRCPMCNSVLESSDDLKSSIISKLTELKKQYASLLDEKSKYDSMEAISSYSYNEKINSMNDSLMKLTRIVDEYNRMQTSIDSFMTTRDGCADIISKCNEELSEVLKRASDNSRRLEIYNYFKSAVSRKFRNFLLDGTISYLNERLKYYSKYLFSNSQVVYLESNGNNINIRLGDSYFEDLSGGEGRRVDIILQLAQRDLSRVESGFSCNLLVLDEVLDYLDSDGISSVLSMLEEESSSVDTMMIVTHRDELDVPNDSEITVVKDQNQLSHIMR